MGRSVRAAKPCKATGKIHWTTRLAAQTHAFRLASDGRLRRTYRCGHCGGWHVTKKGA